MGNIYRFVQESFTLSLNELKSTRNLAVAAMLIAVQVVLGQVAAITMGPYLRISFGYLAVASTGALLGPVVAMLSSAIVDVLVWVIHPTGPYFPGFTLSAMLGGLVYGLAFYRQEIKLKNVVLAKLILDVVVNLGLNTLWLNLLYGKAFLGILPGRALKNLLQYPVDVCLLLPVLRWVQNIARRAGLTCGAPKPQP